MRTCLLTAIIFFTLAFFETRSVHAVTSLFHRSALRQYAGKISSRTITPEEVTLYVQKGGNVNVYQGYDAIHHFFNGTPRRSLLTFFVSSSLLGEPKPPRYLESVKILLENGADPNFYFNNPGPGDSPAFSAVQFAARDNDIDALKLLVAFRGNVNLAVAHQTYVDSDVEHPPLSLVSNVATAEYLLQNGADIHFHDSRQENLIFRAIRSGNPDLVEHFLRKGLSPLEKNHAGQTALQLAESELQGWREKLNLGKIPNEAPPNPDYLRAARKSVDGLEKILAILRK